MFGEKSTDPKMQDSGNNAWKRDGQMQTQKPQSHTVVEDRSFIQEASTQFELKRREESTKIIKKTPSRESRRNSILKAMSSANSRRDATKSEMKHPHLNTISDIKVVPFQHDVQLDENYERSIISRMKENGIKTGVLS